jgi:hypothetical protein
MFLFSVLSFAAVCCIPVLPSPLVENKAQFRLFIICAFEAAQPKKQLGLATTIMIGDN